MLNAMAEMHYPEFSPLTNYNYPNPKVTGNERNVASTRGAAGYNDPEPYT